MNAEIEAEREFSETFNGETFTGSASESISESGLAYGVGGEFKLNERFGIRLDYTRYDIEDAEIDGFMIGGRISF